MPANGASKSHLNRIHRTIFNYKQFNGLWQLLPQDFEMKLSLTTRFSVQRFREAAG